MLCPHRKDCGRNNAANQLNGALETFPKALLYLRDSKLPERRPLVFHCSAGKDRTGVISAVLLSLLGVPEETIVLDYAFSRQNIDLINARLDSSDTYQKLMTDLPEGAYDADPACMRKFLAKLRETKARIQLIRDGDVAGVIATTRLNRSVDIYIGIGGAPEGVLAAAALRCIGGQMTGRLVSVSYTHLTLPTILLV